MSVGLGRFHSPGAITRTEKFRARRRQVLETSEKTTGLKLRQVANQPNEAQRGMFQPGGAAQGLVDSAEEIISRRLSDVVPGISGLRSFGSAPAAPREGGGGGLFGTGVGPSLGDIGGGLRRGAEAVGRGAARAEDFLVFNPETESSINTAAVQAGFDAEQKYIAKRTTPKFQTAFRATMGESLKAVGVPDETADKAANVAGMMLGQVALPSSFLPFVGQGSRLIKVVRAVTLAAALGAEQERAFIQEIEGRDPELHEILIGAGLAATGAGVIESGAIGAGVRAARRGAEAAAPAVRQGVELAGGEAGALRHPGIGTEPSTAPPPFPEPEGVVRTGEPVVGELGTEPRIPGTEPLPSQQVPLAGDPTAPRDLPAARGVERDVVGVGLEQAQTRQRAAQLRDLEQNVSRPAESLDAQSQKLMPSGRDLVADAAPIAGGDPGGLTRLELQTQRQVEARSAGVPLQVRKQQAREYLSQTSADEGPSQQRRPLSWDEIEQANNGRYFDNLATKFDDITASLRGIKNRASQKVVRNIFVVRDILVHREGLVQVARFNAWIGRHQDLLGINIEKGTFDNIAPKEGVRIPESMVQTPMSVYYHPDSYVISPEQATALREMSDQFDVNLKYTQAAGQDVESIGDPAKYWPQAVRDVPQGIDQRVWQPVQLARSPWFTHNRRFPDPHDGARANIKYANGFRAAGSRLTEGIESAANLDALTRIQRLTDLPTELVPKELSDELRLAQTNFQEARKVALKSGSLEDKAAALEAEVALDNAKAAQRVASERIAAKPKILGRVPKDSDLADEVMRYLEREPPQGWDEMFQIMRGTMVTADDSSALLQNWNMLWTNPIGWMKAFALSGSAIRQAPYEFVANNLDLIEEGTRLGFITPPTEFQLSRGGKIAQRVGEAPVIKQTQRVFEWNIFAAQTLRFKGIKNTVLSPDELLEMASVTRRQAGQMFMPGSTDSQIKWLSRLWFAPQFFAGMTSAVTQPLELGARALRGEPTGAAFEQSLKSLGLMFGGAAIMTQGANLYLHGELGNMDDPDKPGFWGIRMPDAVGSGFVFPMGPYQPLIVALAKTSKGDREAIPQMMEGKLSLPMRWFTAAAEGLGVPLKDVRGDPFTRPGTTLTGRPGLDILFDVAPLPIGLSQVAQGIAQDTPITALEVLCGRTTVETPAQELRRKFEEKHQREYDPATDRVIALDDPELAPLVKAADERSAERGFESGEARKQREEIRTQQAEQLRPFIEGIRQGNPQAGSAFREQFAQFKTFMAGVTVDSLFGVDFGDADTEVKRLREELRVSPFSIEFLDTGPDGQFTVDWDAYEQKRDRIIDQLEALRPGFRAAYEGQLRLPPEFADVEQSFLDARSLRDQLEAISPVQGVSAEQYGEIKDFLREVNQKRTQWRLSGRDVPLAQAIAEVGREQRKSQEFLNLANTLRGGIPDSLRNPEYDRFLLANAGTGQDAQSLFLFYPELFRRQSLQLGLAAGQGEPVFQGSGGRRRRSRRSARR